ncbi:hypothetical protein DAEQUDRAFT_413191 [Daedalea quercina L-15889]|uniref:Uncharacterized protein n=1 Tax=Daedalea quercina L-15889 TaxID=1314783 RepID=A0A165THJ7_9APHY|nr:hypothetical protein DAEQUDRAFT_413191 [Daedalea quercina L-15889]
MLRTIHRKPPPLTEGERRLLRQYEGCFKCRRFFVECRTATCTHGFPEGWKYHTLTIADVGVAQARRDKELGKATGDEGCASLPMQTQDPNRALIARRTQPFIESEHRYPDPAGPSHCSEGRTTGVASASSGSRSRIYRSIHGFALR